MFPIGYSLLGIPRVGWGTLTPALCSMSMYFLGEPPATSNIATSGATIPKRFRQEGIANREEPIGNIKHHDINNTIDNNTNRVDS